MDPLKMYFLNMGIFHCYVISQEGGFCSWPLHVIFFLPSGGKKPHELIPMGFLSHRKVPKTSGFLGILGP